MKSSPGVPSAAFVMLAVAGTHLPTMSQLVFQLRELTDDVLVGVPAESHLPTMFQLVLKLRKLTDNVPVGVPAAIVTDDGSVVGVVSERVARLRVVRDDGA